MESQGTPRYVQNIFSWLCSVEKLEWKMVVKMVHEFRPLQIVLNINYSAIWTRFKKKVSNEFDLIYLVDVSGSMSSSLNGVKKYCINISKKIEKELPEFDFNYGGIFYSDPVDVPEKRNTYNRKYK